MTNSFSATDRLRAGIRSGLLGLVLTVGVGTTALVPQEARATGFPTVDIAALIQRILGYITQLSQYAKEITSTATEISQLVQLYKDYEQTLREYDKLLNQVRGLRNMISDADWNTLLRSLEPYYGTSIYAAIPNLDYKSSTFSTDLRSIYSEVGSTPHTPSELSTELSQTDLTNTSSYEQVNSTNEKLFKRQYDRDGMIAANNEASKQRYNDINDLSDRLSSLGDESEVASLQFIAMQQNKMLHYQNEQMSMLNQQMMLMDLETTRDAQQKAAALDYEIERLKKVKSSPITTATYKNGF